MPSKKKKTVKNPMGVALSILAVILIMIGIPGGINALQSEIEADQEPVLLYSLNITDAISVTENENVTYFGLDETGEDYNLIYFNGPITFFAIKFENIDWSKITYYKTYYNDTIDGVRIWLLMVVSDTFSTEGYYHHVGNVEYEISFIDRLILNQEPYIFIKTSSTTICEHIEEGDYMEFSIEFYGIEDPVIPLDLIPNYGALAGGFILTVMALFATPWLNVSDVQNSLKKPVKKKKKNNGGKK